MKKARKPLVLKIVAVIVALLGVAAITVGILQRTIWLPDDKITVSAGGDDQRSAIFIEPGILKARPGRPIVEATAAEGRDVAFIWARERDVDAWFEGLPVTRIVGFNEELPNQFVTEGPEENAHVPAGLPNVLDADVWVQTYNGTGKVVLSELPAAKGRWVLAAVTDGRTPGPTNVNITWPLVVQTPWSTPLIIAGSLLVLGGIGLFVWSLFMASAPRSGPPTNPRRQAAARGGAAGGPTQSAHQTTTAQAEPTSKTVRLRGPVPSAGEPAPSRGQRASSAGTVPATKRDAKPAAPTQRADTSAPQSSPEATARDAATSISGSVKGLVRKLTSPRTAKAQSKPAAPAPADRPARPQPDVTQTHSPTAPRPVANPLIKPAQPPKNNTADPSQKTTSAPAANSHFPSTPMPTKRPHTKDGK